MNARNLPLWMVLACSAGLVQAQPQLLGSVPAAQSVVSRAPERIELHFSSPARLTALTIQKEGDIEAQVLSFMPAAPSRRQSVPVEPMGAGKYIVSWRALGEGDEGISGLLHFTVQSR